MTLTIADIHAQTGEDIGEREAELKKLSKETILALEKVQVVIGSSPKESLAEISNCVSHLIVNRRILATLNAFATEHEVADADSDVGREYVKKRDELIRNMDKAKGHIQRARLDLYKVVWNSSRRTLEFAHKHPTIFTIAVRNKHLRASIRKDNEKDLIDLTRKAERARIEESKNINYGTERSIAVWKEAVQTVLDHDNDTEENRERFRNIDSAIRIGSQWEKYRRLAIIIFTSFASAAISFWLGALI